MSAVVVSPSERLPSPQDPPAPVSLREAFLYWLKLEAICCPNCSTRALANGKTQYHHVAVTPVLVAPGQAAVFPLPPAFVAPQDGHTKQDCELAASARWLPQWAPRIAPWGITCLGDDLYCHQPFCQQVLAQGCHFLFVCLPQSHATLYDWLADFERNGAVPTLVTTRWTGTQRLTDTYRYCQRLPLRERDDALYVDCRCTSFVSFGGPAGQIAMMHTELVERRRWIGEHRFLHALNYAMLLPGPEAQQLATYIGWLMHGTLGGILAGVLFVLPSLAILIALTWVYLVYGDVPAVAGILYGIKPAVTAIVAFAAWRIGSRALRNGVLWTLAAAAFLAIFALNIPFPAIVLAAGLIGAVGGRLAPDKFKTGGGHGTSSRTYGPALIDDHSPPPAHAGLSWPRTLVYCLVGVGTWGLVEGALLLSFGWAGPLTQMGWFFTKAALVTFGGAYAVLPYVYQGGVETHGWLTGQQMIDGLALGETTPGPLIMVVAFVGFVGGWTKELFGPDAQVLAGIAGASVATLLHLPALLPVHPGGCAGGGGDPPGSEIHRPPDRHHRRGGGGDRQPGGLLCVACALAPGDARGPLCGALRVVLAADHGCRLPGPVAL